MLTPTSEVEFFILASGDFIAVSADTWLINIVADRLTTTVEIATLNNPTVVQQYADAAEAVTEVGRLVVYLGMRFEQNWTPLSGGTAYVVSAKLASARRVDGDRLELVPRALHHRPASIAWRQLVAYPNSDALDEDFDWLVDAVGITDRVPVISTSSDDTDALPEAMWLSAWPDDLVRIAAAKGDPGGDYDYAPEPPTYADALQFEFRRLQVSSQRLVELHKFYWETTFRDGSGSGTTKATDDTRRRLHVEALYNRLLDPRPIGEKLYRFIVQSLLALDDKVVRAPDYDGGRAGEPLSANPDRPRLSVITPEMLDAAATSTSYAPVVPPPPTAASGAPDLTTKVITELLKGIAPQTDPTRLDWDQIRAAVQADPELARTLGISVF